MWINCWGQIFDSKQEALDYVVEHFVDDEILINELQYDFNATKLLEWIFEDESIRAKFTKDFAHLIKQAKQSFAECCVEEEDE